MTVRFHRNTQHSSQSGTAAGRMNQAMGANPANEEEEDEDPQDKVIAVMRSRKMRGNASYLVFTKTTGWEIQTIPFVLHETGWQITPPTKAITKSKSPLRKTRYSIPSKPRKN